MPIRHGRMLASPFAFFRGTAALMAADLAQTPQSGITVQLCGDAHLSNFGGFAAPDRELVFDINDFDETARGPWEWDVKRLATSIAIAGRELGLTAAERGQAVEASVRSYREAMREFAALRNLELWYARLDVSRLLSHAGDQVSRRERTAFKRRIAGASAKDHLRAMSKLTARVDGRLRIVARPPRIVPVEELFPAHDERGGRRRRCARCCARTGAACRSSGATCSRATAIGTWRGGSAGSGAWERGPGSSCSPGATTTTRCSSRSSRPGARSLEPYTGRSTARNHGQRVVQGQRLMQVDGDIFLGWLRAEGIDGTPRDYYVRQLWDWKLGAEVELMSPARLTVYGRLCAWTLARAHARTGDRVAIASYLGPGERVRPRRRRLRRGIRGPERARPCGVGRRRARGAGRGGAGRMSR